MEELGSVGVVSLMSQASVSTLGLADEPKEPEVGDISKRVAIVIAKKAEQTFAFGAVGWLISQSRVLILFAGQSLLGLQDPREECKLV